MIKRMAFCLSEFIFLNNAGDVVVVKRMKKIELILNSKIRNEDENTYFIVKDNQVIKIKKDYFFDLDSCKNKTKILKMFDSNCIKRETMVLLFNSDNRYNLKIYFYKKFNL